jgi:hypothetical protein
MDRRLAENLVSQIPPLPPTTNTHLLDRCYDLLLDFRLDLPSSGCSLLTWSTNLWLLINFTIAPSACAGTGRVIILLISYAVSRYALRTDPPAFRFLAPLPPFVIFALISTPSGIFCNSLTSAVVLPPTSTKSIVAGEPSGYQLAQPR